MNIFKYNDYKLFVQDYKKSLPKAGRGFFKGLANLIGSSPVYISQVFSGERHLTQDQAILIALEMELNPLEKEYFLRLVDLQRLSHHKAISYCKQKVKELKQQGLELSRRVDAETIESEAVARTYYSRWYYSGVKLASSLSMNNSVEDLSRSLSIDKKLVENVLNFLIENELVVKKGNRLTMGKAKTHLPKESNLVLNRQIDWRIKGFQHMARQNPNDLFFTGPMSVSSKIAQKIRTDINELIEEIYKEVVKEKADELVCLNIDWFRFGN